ncbi:MAG: GAF domain-containing protein [Chloroflexi bacterium]|nr:GAF domain-containing protein [Chloroflexota bacterium]
MPPLLSLAILLVALGLAGWVLLRRRRSRAALVARVAELTLLSEVGRAIVSAELDEAQLAELIYRQAGQIVDTRFFQVGLFEADCYRTLIWVRDGQRVPNVRFDLSPGDDDGIVGWVRRGRQPLLVRDFEAEMEALPARPRYTSADPPRSAVFVPLVAGENCLGVMAIQSRAPAAFSLDHLRLLSILANQVAAALANARLFQQTRARARELELISAVSREISAIQPLPDLFRDVVNRIAATFGYYAVNLFERNGERLVLRASTSPSFLATALVLSVGEGLVGRAAATRASTVAQQVGDDPHYLPHPEFAAARSEMAVPLLIEDDVLGVLDVQGAQPGLFVPETVRLMESLAAQLAIAILEANNYEATRRRADHLAAIAESAGAVASILVLDDLLDEVVDLVEDHLGYEQASVFLLESDALVFRAGVGGAAARWRVEGHSIPLDDPGALATAARTARPVQRALPEPARAPDPHARGDREDARSELAAPLIMAGRVLGVLDAQSSQAGAFGPDDQQVLQTLAGNLAVAVRNARLFAAERRRRVLAETMREVSTALATTLELDDVLQRILAGLARLVPFDAASVLLMEEPGRYALRAAAGPETLTGAVGRRIELDEPALPAAEPAAEAVAGVPADSAAGAPVVNRRPTSPSKTPGCTPPSAKRPGSAPPCCRWPRPAPAPRTSKTYSPLPPGSPPCWWAWIAAASCSGKATTSN